MRYTTIRETVALPDCPVNERTLRALVKRGECPGFYNGNRFLVNSSALFSLLEDRSLATVRKEGAARE